jgi:hypothetical protein
MGPFEHEDGKVQHSVLVHVLAEYPIICTVSELVSELAGDTGEFERRDAVERAVRDLASVGLLHRCGPLVLPTRAACYFNALCDEYA